MASIGRRVWQPKIAIGTGGGRWLSGACSSWPSRRTVARAGATHAASSSIGSAGPWITRARMAPWPVPVPCRACCSCRMPPMRTLGARAGDRERVYVAKACGIRSGPASDKLPDRPGAPAARIAAAERAPTPRSTTSAGPQKIRPRWPGNGPAVGLRRGRLTGPGPRLCSGGPATRRRTLANGDREWRAIRVGGGSARHGWRRDPSRRR